MLWDRVSCRVSPRPGGNITGLTFFQPELAAKRLELLKAAVPDLREVGIFLNSANPMNAPVLPQITDLAKSLKLELHQFAARRPAEFEGTFSAMAAKRVGGLVILDDAVLLANAPALARLALIQHLPSSGWSDFALAGGLLAYGVSFPDMFRRAATFVDKILKGAKPSDLPMERAAKFETIVNQKTANALGFKRMPTSLRSGTAALSNSSRFAASSGWKKRRPGAHARDRSQIRPDKVDILVVESTP